VHSNAAADSVFMDNAARIGLLCLAYMAGLFLSPYPVAVGLLAIGTIGIFYLLDRQRKVRLPITWSLATALILIAGSGYAQWRIPQPTANDVSLFVNTVEGKSTAQFATVRGSVDSYPKITRNERSQFWMQTTQLSQIQGDSPSPSTIRRVSGRLYVTAPLLSTTGLKPGVEVIVTGNLYKPPTSLNPGGMDFADYLARSGSFTGLRAAQLMLPDEEQIRTWDLDKIRQRIVRSQVRWLDVPVGPLVAAMALGGDVVDLPFDLKDAFVRVGLAHALAASGFQVSLIVSGVIAIARRWLSRAWQFGLALAGIGIFVLMAGPQPSVLRAAVMGMAVAIGLLTSRQIRPLQSILLAAVLLLLVNPLWIWDVGFQLSFLATLGLVVSATPIQKKLDWLPPTIAELVSVPLAATIWTLPIQLWTFKVLPIYALPANVFASPLVTIISIGGMVSAALGALIPPVGSAIAWVLFYPTQLLIGLVQWFSQLPGSNMAVGQIALWQLLCLYGAILLVWLRPKLQKRWLLVTIGAILLIVLPLWIGKFQELKITALATGDDRVLVVQHRYRTTLIDTGDSDTARFTVLPFLTAEGVNNIERAFALNGGYTNQKGWQTLRESIAIDKLSVATEMTIAKVATELLPIGQTQSFGAGKANLITTNSPLMELEIENQRWLVGGNIQLDRQRELSTTQRLQPILVLYWPGGMLTEQFIKVIQPQVAIASTSNPDPETIQKLEKLGTKVFITGRDGAIQWTTAKGFVPLLEDR
jgi:competence protein ComEC